MAKTIFDELGGTYIRQGDYFLPCLSLPAEKEVKPIGVWGQRHLRYLKQHRKVLYTNLLTSGKLNSYLVDIDEQADKLSAGEISKDDYDRWRYYYPKYDTTQLWAKVPSQELSDALAEAFKDKLKE